MDRAKESAKSRSLLGLPFEIRQAIYSHTIPEYILPKHPRLPPVESDLENDDQLPLNLLLVNHQVHTEVFEAISRSCFVFITNGAEFYFLDKKFINKLLDISPSFFWLRRIKHCKIDVRFFETESRYPSPLSISDHYFGALNCFDIVAMVFRDTPYVRTTTIVLPQGLKIENQRLICGDPKFPKFKKIFIDFDLELLGSRLQGSRVEHHYAVESHFDGRQWGDKITAHFTRPKQLVIGHIFEVYQSEESFEHMYEYYVSTLRQRGENVSDLTKRSPSEIWKNLDRLKRSTSLEGSN
ncbi:MAG: hypothetical protein LQ351_003284 [Letrouitia transgressa]|nr:MAG: hypothetical protein LQ351_003284 [Letrouitia transgressa]